MSYCGECGYNIILEASFCQKCGSKVENNILVENSEANLENTQNWFCSNCDHENKDAKFCVKCGGSNNYDMQLSNNKYMATKAAKLEKDFLTIYQTTSFSKLGVYLIIHFFIIILLYNLLIYDHEEGFITLLVYIFIFPFIFSIIFLGINSWLGRIIGFIVFKPYKKELFEFFAVIFTIYYLFGGPIYFFLWFWVLLSDFFGWGTSVNLLYTFIVIYTLITSIISHKSIFGGTKPIMEHKGFYSILLHQIYCAIPLLKYSSFI